MFRAVLCAFLTVSICIGYAGDKDVFARRRDAILARIGNSIAVLRGMDSPREYIPFRQDNNFYYLTGVEVPGAILLLDGVQQRSILFLPARNEENEIWEGKRLYPGPEAGYATGMDEVLESARFEGELAERMKESRFLYTPLMPYEAAAASRDLALVFESERLDNPWDGRKSREASFRDALRKKLGGTAVIEDLTPMIDAMRRIKDDGEIARLREAGRIGSLGLKRAMQAAKPGMYEYQLAAVAEFTYLWNGSSGNAYFPIVGSGPNSCVLHYCRNRRRMEHGDIVVMDFGPDYAYSVTDVTRTFPVSGKFDAEQAKVYSAVLEAQKAALDAVRPGASFDDLEKAAEKVLKAHNYEKYRMHAVSHYVGMAVHDVGRTEPFDPGVVIAVEPGVYIPEKNLGVRIEDTVLVTENGYEVLTREAPKEVVEIETLMSTNSVVPDAGNLE